MASRRIVIDIYTTIDRHKFDVRVTADGETTTDEKVSRDVIHVAAREAINTALASFD